MDIILGLAILFVGGVIGWKYREFTAIRMMNDMQLDKLEEELQNQKIYIKVEQQQGTWFAYDQEDGMFLAQGDDWKSVQKRLVERFPGKRFILDEDNMRKMGLLRTH